MVCRDISLGQLTGYYICLGCPLLLILLSCYPWTFECTPTSAGAEMHICLVECAVRVLGSALDVRPSVALREQHPNHCELNTASTRKNDSECEANAVGCRPHGKEGKRVYTLVLNRGIHYTQRCGVRRSRQLAPTKLRLPRLPIARLHYESTVLYK